MIEKKEFLWNRLYIPFDKRSLILQVSNINVEMALSELTLKMEGPKNRNEPIK
jgi:hypothetical protein